MELWQMLKIFNGDPGAVFAWRGVKIICDEDGSIVDEFGEKLILDKYTVNQTYQRIA